MNKASREFVHIESRGESLVLVVSGHDVFTTPSTESMWEHCVSYQIRTGRRVENLEEMCG